jgi:UDPglucose 6-dehydrogenase
VKVTVIGSGYVGLVTGACLADVGNDVLCVDVDQRKIDMLLRGEIPIHEPGLDEIVKRNAAAGRLRFTTSPEEGAKWGVVQMIAVGTPPDEDGSADLKYVLAAARSIGKHMDGFRVIVDKSTVPVGTGDKVEAAIKDELNNRTSTLDFAVVSNPEFLKEGAAIEDFMKPDRIVIGVSHKEAEDVMRELYAPFQRNHEKMVVMGRRSAELTKYAANAMLATRISFMNELSRLAEKLGADIEAVRVGIGSDPRIGYSFLYAGTGYGGSCFPKDVKALISSFGEASIDSPLMQAVEEVNDKQKFVLVDKAKRELGSLKGKHFAIWGLAFKPNTDDMREAPSRVIIEALIAEGATVAAYDPVALEEALRVLGGVSGVTFKSKRDDCLVGADALMIVTEWKEFRSPDFAAIKTALKSPLILDGRNLYDPAVVARYGLKYLAIGRQS